MVLSKVEKSVIRQLHLQGFVKWGSMKKSDRVPFLKSLEAKQLIDSNCRPTQKGIDLAKD